MRVAESNKERLIVEHNDRSREWTMGFGISLIGWLPFFLNSDGWFLFCGKFLFLATFILMGLLNVRDEYTITFDKKKQSITINYRNIIEIIGRKHGTDLVFDIDRITHAYVSEQVHEKKKLNKIFLLLDRSLSIPLTDTLYFNPKFADDIAGAINQWLIDNKIGTRYGEHDSDDDSDDDGAQRVKRRTNKVT